MRFELSPRGRSGAALNVPVEATFEPAVNPGPFAWITLIGRAVSQGYTHLQRAPGVVIKQNADKSINDIEFTVTSAYHKRGFAVPSVKKIDETHLEIERIDGLTLAEGLFYDCHANITAVAEKLDNTYRLDREMNHALSGILTAEQKEYLLKRQKKKLMEEGVSQDDAIWHPLTARVEARAKKLPQVTFDPVISKTLTSLESILKPLTEKYAGWSLESNCNNFIGNTRIDMNGIYYGVDDDSFLLDTPYMLSDTFWIRRNDDSHLGQYQAIEKLKDQLVGSSARKFDEDPQEKRCLFQGSRIFRNILQLFYAYHNAFAKKDEAKNDDLLAQAKLYHHLNEMFAHYEMQDTGLNSILAYHQDDKSAAAEILRSTASAYSSAVENMMRQMCDVLLPDKQKLSEYARSSSFIRQNYKELKQNLLFSLT